MPARRPGKSPQIDLRIGATTTDAHLAQIHEHATEFYDGNTSRLVRDYTSLGIALRSKFADNFDQMMRSLVGHDYRRPAQP